MVRRSPLINQIIRSKMEVNFLKYNLDDMAEMREHRSVYHEFSLGLRTQERTDKILFTHLAGNELVSFIQ